MSERSTACLARCSTKKPGFIEAVAYDTALMVLETLEKHPVRFRSDLRDRLLAVSEYRGITGLTGFDPNGDSIKQPYLLRIRGKTVCDR